MELRRDDLLGDSTLVGSAFTHAYSDRLDCWVRAIATEEGIPDGVALAAIGGYGRREMAPQSDLDIVLVHRSETDPTAFADRIWYPMWDAGIKLGQRTDTVDGLLKLARSDLDTATALLDVRHLAGDASITDELALGAATAWREDATRSIERLAQRVREQHHRRGEVAFTLGPDIKLDRGGLRDVHALRWAAAAGALTDVAELESLDEPTEVLLRARVELHRLTGRAGDRLALDFQDEVAAALGYDDADVLMTEVAAAGRSIAWVSDAAWFWAERSFEQRRRGTDREQIDHDIEVDGSLLRLHDQADPADDPTAVLRVASAAASRRAFIDHDTLIRLADAGIAYPDPWTEGMRRSFVTLLELGHAATPVLEAIDQVGLMSDLIPEWAPCRSRPQRNAYHRFTVDRHLLEAAAEAAGLVHRVSRPDLLVTGALLHDIGKGYAGDHTDVGVELIDTIATRMGFAPDDVDLLVEMCRHHLLLPDIATRRDLDDDGTIRMVAEAVGSVELLELLWALTEADSIATGPSAWNSSKAELVTVLVERTRNVLEGSDPGDVVAARFPTAEQLDMMRLGGFQVRVVDDRITVVQTDRPGVFFRVAGVLTLNGLDIVAAAAHTEGDVALSEFQVGGHGDLDTKRLESQLEAGARGEIALEARVDERRVTYARTRRRQSARPVSPSLTFDNGASETATVIEVTCPDEIGVLYRIARALTELGVTISSARIQTIGDVVVDAFYVTHNGAKLDDPHHRREIERAVLHAIRRK